MLKHGVHTSLRVSSLICFMTNRQKITMQGWKRIPSMTSSVVDENARNQRKAEVRSREVPFILKVFTASFYV